jgi:hypothetical protein
LAGRDSISPRQSRVPPTTLVRVSRQMGHSRPSTTLDIYAHEIEEVQHGDDLSVKLTAALGAFSDPALTFGPDAGAVERRLSSLKRHGCYALSRHGRLVILLRRRSVSASEAGSQ